MNAADEIFAIFETHGGEAYLGEGVSQLEHALQAAWLAERTGAAGALVVAALVHDIGHLVGGETGDLAEAGIDGRHEAVGRLWLAARFGEDVTEPVRLHVEAKRYLCATDAGYRARLSSASERSLHLQGGPLSAQEAAAFEKIPYAREAAALRRWDDAAKAQSWQGPAMEHYRKKIEAAQRGVQRNA